MREIRTSGLTRGEEDVLRHRLLSYSTTTRGNASIVGPDRVVFNIKGNAYRLVAAIDYRRGIVFIKWLGSHQEYDKIDVRTVQYDDQAHQD